MNGAHHVFPHKAHDYNAVQCSAMQCNATQRNTGLLAILLAGQQLLLQLH